MDKRQTVRLAKIKEGHIVQGSVVTVIFWGLKWEKYMKLGYEHIPFTFCDIDETPGFIADFDEEN